MTFNSMNAVLTEATKKDGKLTAKAQRTRKLVVSVDVPSTLADINFKIIDPSGKQLTPKDGTFTLNKHTSAKTNAFYASASHSQASVTYNRIELVFAPTEKLKSGLYSIELREDLKTIGTLQVRLR
jgi:hypothetical protein